MDRTLTRVAALALVLLFAATSAFAAGNAANGKTLFARCSVCHKTAKDAGNGVGPNLFGVSGRMAGSAPGFAYSPAMKGAGFAWSDDKLTAYVMNPKQTVPGDRMPFNGIPNQSQAADVVAYLDTLK